MKDNEFAILHQLPETQLLIDTEYDPDENKYSLSMKFLHTGMDAHVTATLGWGKKHKKDFIETFEKMRDINYATEWYNKLNK